MPQTSAPREAPDRFPMVASWAVTLSLFVVALIGIIFVRGDAPAWAVAVGLVLSTLLCVDFLAWQQLVLAGSRRRLVRALFGAQVLGGTVALVWFHAWCLTAMALATVMGSLRRREATVVVTVLVGAMLAFVTTNWQVPQGIATTTISFGFGALLNVLLRFAAAARELHRTREELARTRVDEERVRIQRDLHDVLGRTLVAASMRNQVALRTLDRGPDVTRGHLEQLHAVITEGQARLRAITSGPVIAGLADEIESARTLCERTGIRFEADAEPVPPGEVERLCGAVVRESVTNLLKHSSARRCTIGVHVTGGAVVTSVENDGCSPTAPRPDGTGLTRLREAAERLGGELSAEPAAEGLFRVTARVPQAG